MLMGRKNKETETIKTIFEKNEGLEKTKKVDNEHGAGFDEILLKNVLDHGFVFLIAFLFMFALVQAATPTDESSTIQESDTGRIILQSNTENFNSNPVQTTEQMSPLTVIIIMLIGMIITMGAIVKAWREIKN